MHFGVLRVLNDDIVQPSKGFDTHPHADMEIVSYVVEGQLTHKDSMGNANTLTRGQSQYMSAGTGVFHSEYNNQQDKELRFIQI
jgi:redox-sensitive bicupin YhaK (pirin superfamily)